MGRGNRGGPPPNRQTLQSYEAHIQLTLAVIVIILNVVEIFILKFIQRSRRTFEYLLLSLSISDLFFGVTVVVMSTSQIFGYLKVLKQAHLLHLIFAVSSVLHISWVTLDRLLVITLPMRFKLLFQERQVTGGRFKRVFFIIGLSWIMPILLMLGILVDAHMNKKGKFKKQINIGILICVLFANAFFIPSYFILISKLCSIQNKVAPVDQETTNSGPTSQTTNSQNGLGSNKRTRLFTAKQQHILLLTCLTALAFSCCTLPIAIEQFRNGWDSKIPFYAKLMLVLNSALNSVFYFGYWRLRKFVKRRRAQRRT